MNYIIQNRKPESFFRFFEEISAIPRMSYHEEAIADYLVDFAKTRGLDYYRDTWNNVLIKKPASKGYEEKAPILFQGHTDMVCEKESGSDHDFLKDPLDLWIDGHFLRARGTTLGADDGMAVATMLALLDGEIEDHPAYECLFTAAEEAGIVGAPKFDFSKISARTLINIDAGDPKYPLCSCSGALRTRITMPFATEPIQGHAIHVHIGGLMGGHAGADIHRGRANANKVMGRLISALSSEGDVRIVSVNSGSKDSGIMRECDAILSVSNVENATAILKKHADAISSELVDEDKNFFVSVESATAETMMDQTASDRTCGMLACLPTGVFSMCRDLPYLVEFSRNFGTVITEEQNVIFTFSTRSASNSKLDSAAHELEAFAAMIGAQIEHFGRYPGWEYTPTSHVRDAYLSAYREITANEAIAVGVHAGIECGVICAAIPDMDTVAIAPNAQFLHSPAERLDLDSCETFWRVLRRMIEIL